jgi:hypothetical protein
LFTYTELDGTGPAITNWTGTNYTGDLDLGCPDGCWGGPRSGIFANEFTNSACGNIQAGTLDAGYTTYYFRTRFVAPSNTIASGILYFTNYVEDGVIFYLNGTEIYRTNLPSGPITQTTKARLQVNASCTPLLLSVTNLLMPPPATKVFAAEVHESGNAGDFEIDFGTSVAYGTNPPPYFFFVTNTSPLPPLVHLALDATRPTNNVITWTTNVGGGVYWGLDSNTNLGTTNWVKLSNSPPYTNAMTGLRKWFRLHAR